MPASMLKQPLFQNDEKAREYLEALQWPNGPVCPHCGSAEKHYRLRGKSHRTGLYKCADCRGQFTVTVGTLFERSKIPLHIWFQAIYLLCSSKRGISSQQLHRRLGVTYKTAWFMAHRIRDTMLFQIADQESKNDSHAEGRRAVRANGEQKIRETASTKK